MSRVGLNAAIASMPVATPYVASATESGPGDSGFSSILSSIDGAGKSPPHGRKIADFQDSRSTANSGTGTGGAADAEAGEALAKADPSSSLEAALAALGYGQIAAAPAAPPAAPTPPSYATSQASKLVGRTALAGASSLGSAVGAAGDGADAQSWDISGAVPLQNLLASDSSLGLRGFQPKTHLAVADAIPVKSGAAIQRRAASPSSTASTSGASSSQGPSASAGSEAVAGANPFNESGADDAARGRGSSGAAAPALASASEISSPIAATDVSQPFSSISVDPGQASTTSVGLDQLSDFIAEQASQMTGANEAATPLNAPQVVKELEISLDPADLGAVSLKLRLTGGKLSVVIGVSNASTLASIENDREAIASRLGVDPQSTDSLVIKAQGSSQVDGGGNDAIDPQDYSQSDARGGATADSASGQSGGASANARSSQAPSGAPNGPGASASNLTGALLV